MPDAVHECGLHRDAVLAVHNAHLDNFPFNDRVRYPETAECRGCPICPKARAFDVASRRLDHDNTHEWAALQSAVWQQHGH